MFTPSPKYATLSRQVALGLAEQIRSGAFSGGLPGERWLATSLQVSRRTVRAALALLRREKLLQTIPGQETRVLQFPTPREEFRALRAIGLILPDPVDQLEPYSTVFFDFLRALLYENGYRLETHVGHSFFSTRPGAALVNLVARFPCDAWILAFSTRACQAWFHARRIPTVIVGTAHEGLALPYVDVDYQATARHAAQFFLGKGHRRLALIINEKNRAGDRLTEQGFLEGVEKSAGTGATAQVFRHAGTMDSLRRMTDRILGLAQCPTALLIANPYHYMGIAGLLAERGLKVSRDLSLLCRDDDFCLRYLPVEPSRYLCRPEKRARAIFSTVMWALRPGADRDEPRHVLLLPELVEGASVAKVMGRG
jgi:DNA-binding LacI/PurR family transcriptional regulator